MLKLFKKAKAGLVGLANRVVAMVTGLFDRVVAVVTGLMWSLAMACVAAHQGQSGRGGVTEVILLAFIAIMVIFNLIPTLVDQNALIQADADASAITKLAGEMGEWFLPLGAVLAAGFLVFRKVRGG